VRLWWVEFLGADEKLGAGPGSLGGGMRPMRAGSLVGVWCGRLVRGGWFGGWCGEVSLGGVDCREICPNEAFLAEFG